MKQWFSAEPCARVFLGLAVRQGFASSEEGSQKRWLSLYLVGTGQNVRTRGKHTRKRTPLLRLCMSRVHKGSVWPQRNEQSSVGNRFVD